jgi:hypothetical protein
MSQSEERSRQAEQVLYHQIDVREQLPTTDPLGGCGVRGIDVPIKATPNATIAEFMKLRIRIATVWLGLPDRSPPDPVWSSLADDIEAQTPSLELSSEEETNAKEIAELRVELRQLKRVLDNHIARDT